MCFIQAGSGDHWRVMDENGPCGGGSFSPRTNDNLSRPESSSRTQNPKALPSFGTIMPITGGSAMEFETKRQRNNYFSSVNTIINDGPVVRP
jgi:hypothetical protein